MKVVTYNLFHLGWAERLPVIAKVIRDQEADAVALMEATSIAEVEVLARSLDMDFYYGQGNHRWAVAWLSRLPIRRAGNHQLAPLFHTLVEIEVVADGVPHRLFATHLRSFGPDRRLALEARRRVIEMHSILATLRPFSEEPHVLVGDFNAARPRERLAWRPPVPELLRRYHRVRGARKPIQLVLDAGYVDCYRHLHPTAPGYTILTQCPWERIDFVFASPAMADRLTGCDVATGPGTEVASDHFPVWAEFA